MTSVPEENASARRVTPKRRSRHFRLLVFLVLTCFGLGAILLAWRGESQLMERATRIPNTAGWSRGVGSYRWISDHEIVHFPMPSQGKVPRRLDLRTGTESDAPRAKFVDRSVPASTNPNLPQGAQVLEVVSSETGDRLAWSVRFFRQPPLYGLLRPAYRYIGQGYGQSIELWVSDRDGRNLRRIGIQELEKPGEIVPNCLAWLPDGRRVSFLYLDSLYVIEANGS